MRRHCCGYEIELRYPGFMEKEVSSALHPLATLTVGERSPGLVLAQRWVGRRIAADGTAGTTPTRVGQIWHRSLLVRLEFVQHLLQKLWFASRKVDGFRRVSDHVVQPELHSCCFWILARWSPFKWLRDNVMWVGSKARGWQLGGASRSLHPVDRRRRVAQQQQLELVHANRSGVTVRGDVVRDDTSLGLGALCQHTPDIVAVKRASPSFCLASCQLHQGRQPIRGMQQLRRLAGRHARHGAVGASHEADAAYASLPVVCFSRAQRVIRVTREWAATASHSRPCLVPSVKALQLRHTLAVLTALTHLSVLNTSTVSSHMCSILYAPTTMRVALSIAVIIAHVVWRAVSFTSGYKDMYLRSDVGADFVFDIYLSILL
jgi:hypothetical protein